MTVYCKIKSGKVVDRALFDGPMPEDWPDYARWVANDEADIGWRHRDGVFTAPPPAPMPKLTLEERQMRREAERVAAYQAESDPLGMRLLARLAETGAIKDTPEVMAFLARREEIRTRLPDVE